MEIDPHYAAARAFLGLYLIQRVVQFISPSPMADVAEALESAERAIDLAPRDPEVLENAGLVYFNSGRYEDAVAALTRAVAIAPFNLVAWGYLGCAHSWTGDDTKVVEGLGILERLLKTAPDHPSVPYWLFFKAAACMRLDRIAGGPRRGTPVHGAAAELLPLAPRVCERARTGGPDRDRDGRDRSRDDDQPGHHGRRATSRRCAC